MKEFKLNSQYKPLGDQPKAIDALVDGINNNVRNQTLLGVTGSGKTFTMENVIEKVLIMQSNILSVIMTTISRKHMCQEQIHSLIKKHLSMKILI